MGNNIFPTFPHFTPLQKYNIFNKSQEENVDF
jgi:hypothetical protein